MVRVASELDTSDYEAFATCENSYPDRDGYALRGATVAGEIRTSCEQDIRPESAFFRTRTLSSLIASTGDHRLP